MRYITIILLALVCAACSSALPSLKPYRMDIQQGNVVTSKMMLQLRPGMTKSQVRFIMGTPLIQDTFHANRWDYFYEMRKDGKIIERRRVIMEFENDALARVRGDVIPAGTGEATDEPTAGTSPVQPSKKKAKDEKGLLDRLKFWKDDDAAQEKSQEAPAELISPAAKPAAPAAPAEKPAPQPATEPPAVPAEPKAAQEPTTETTPARQEGMPEPGAPLGPDPEHVERGAAPTVETPRASEIGESPAQAEPASPSAEPVRRDPAPAPAPQSEPEPAPAAAEPAAKPQPAQTREPAEQRRPAAEPEPEAGDLPPEDDPGYFERMLEKIGF